MIINTDNIDELINSKVPATRIGEETGISIKGLTNYRNGQYDINNMTRGYLEKLQVFYDSHKNDKPNDIKLTGIKNAVSEFNDWQGAARIYVDCKAMSVWTQVYSGPDSWDEYNSDDIYQIWSKATQRLDERDDTITMRQIRELVGEVLENAQKKI